MVNVASHLGVPDQMLQSHIRRLIVAGNKTLRDRVIQAKRKNPIKANELEDSNVLHHHKCFFIRERPRSPSTCIGTGSTKSLGSSLVPPRPSTADSGFYICAVHSYNWAGAWPDSKELKVSLDVSTSSNSYQDVPKTHSVKPVAGHYVAHTATLCALRCQPTSTTAPMRQPPPFPLLWYECAVSSAHLFDIFL